LSDRDRETPKQAGEAPRPGAEREVLVPFEPPYPRLTALGVLSLWIVILSLPMLTGQFLAAPNINDQYFAGYAFRNWAAQQFASTGSVPLWNPTLFGGLPFVGAMHGDIFYPTAWLRLVLPTDTAMNLGFFVHYILAGLFTYWFLRLFRVSWTGSVVGGLAYQLTGVVASYPSPGHDGKLFVTALLPLGLVMLTYAIRERRYAAYAAFALVVGLALLSPQAQMTQYFLIATGIFTLYLIFGEKTDAKLSARLGAMGLALAAVGVGFGVAMIQYLPFIAYIPFSPRGEGALRGYEWSVSYAIPWNHVPEFFLAHFNGAVQTYWGSNPIKLHSEYLGLPVIALGVVGAMDRLRRPLSYWVLGIGVLFLLISLGGSTPFYRAWWSIVPFVKQTRAPGMALYVVAFALAVFAAFGVERVERGEARWTSIWMVVGGAVAVLGMGGAWGTMAESLAREIGPAFVPRVQAAQAEIRFGAVSAGLALLAVGAVVFLYSQKRIAVPILSAVIIGVVGTDLWLNAKGFWSYSRPQAELYAEDEIIEYLKAAPKPNRVFDWYYQGAALMAHGVAQLLGYHGNQLHSFDQLMGGHDVWRSPQWNPLRYWDIYAVNTLILPGGMTDSVPGFREILSDVSTGKGSTASLFERIDPVPYARVVAGAAKVPDDQAVPTLQNPLFSLDRVVILDPQAPVDPAPLEEVPARLEVRADVVEWEPGRMRVELTPAPETDAYVVVSENYYKDWQAQVDGAEAPVMRGNVSLITVPVPAGAREVDLVFRSPEYARGKLVTMLSLLLIVVGLVVPEVARRRGSG